jgi:hypothetical protein
MSLEQALERTTAAQERTTAALERLIEILAATPVVTVETLDRAPVEIAALDSDPEPPAPAEKPKAAKKSRKEAAPEPRPLEQTAPSPAAGAADAPVMEAVATATEPPSYQTVANAILALSSAKGKAAAVGVLKRFGCSTLKDASAAQYADILAAAEAEL